MQFIKLSRNGGSKRIVILSIAFMLTCFSISPLALNAQVADMPGEAMPSQLSYAVSPGAPDTINPSTLNVHLNIPLFKKPGMGSETAYNLTYDSNIFSISGINNTMSYDNIGFGWRDRIAAQPSIGHIDYGTNIIDCYDASPYSGEANFTGYAIQYTDFSLYAADYSFHQFNINYYDTSNCNGTFYDGPGIPPDSAWVWAGFATDGSGYYLVPAANSGVDPADPNYARVVGPSGIPLTVDGASSLWIGEGSNLAQVDTNGNSIWWHYDNPPQLVIQNGLWTYSYTSTDPTTFTVTDTANAHFKVQGFHVLSGTDPDPGAPFKILYTDSNGNQQTVTVNYGSFTLQTNFGITGVPDIGPLQVQLPTSVVYPDGTSYQFGYEHTPGFPGSVTSRLNYLKTPTGEVITYQYTGSNNGMAGVPEINLSGSSLDCAPLGLIRTTSDGVTTYNRTLTKTGSTQYLHATTTITRSDAGQNQTVLDYVLSSQSGFQDLVYTETKKQVFQGSASGTPLLTTIECHNGNTGDCTNEPSINTSDTELNITNTYANGASSRVDTFYNVNALPTKVDEYDYGASSPTRSTVTAYASLIPSLANEGGIFDRPQSVTVYDANGNIAKKTTYGYDNYPLTPVSSLPGARGNLTDIYSQIDSSGATTHTLLKYSDTGMIQSVIDANANAGTGGSATTYTYDSSGALPSSINVTNADGSNINGVSHATSYVYDDNTGLLKNITDPNNATINYTYDALGRIADIIFPDTRGGTHGETKYCYNVLTSSGNRTFPSGCSNGTINSVTTTVIAVPNLEVSNTAYDGFWRPIHVTAPNGAVTDTTYDADGNIASVSNLHISTSDPTYGITSYTYDALGRKLLQCNPDNGIGSTCTPGSSYQQWSYTGNVTTLSDELRHSWQTTYDGLGRLASVVEPGNLLTSYIYDPLNNLTAITQHGVTGETPRTRSFIYDSLSRLTSATNPETGTITYTYDNNGNIKTTVGPAPNSVPGSGQTITTTFTYDALNRLKLKSFSGGSQTEGFGYDGKDDNGVSLAGITNVIGRLSHISNDVNAAANYSYDPMGRIIQSTFCMPSDCNYDTKIQAAYDLAGNLTDLTYPDGHHITQGWDAAGHLSSSSLVDINGTSVSQSYLQSASYFPDGSPRVMTLGNGVQQIITKNNRFQLQSLTASTPLAPFNSQPFLSHTYCYVNCTSGGTANTGNIWQIADTLRSANTQDYTYDSLNRITGFNLGGASNQTYQSDSFGNMTRIGSGGPINTFDATTNRISNLSCLGPGGTAQYDAAGNQHCDGDSGLGTLHQYTFDGENRLSSVSNGGSTIASYTYGADGSRVRKSNADGSFTEYVYFGGQPIAEHHSDGTWTDYIYGNSKKIAMVRAADSRVHTHGVSTGNWTLLRWNLPTPADPGGGSYTVKAGDKLCLRQYNSNAVGGPLVWFTNGYESAWQWTDYNGVVMNDLATENQWVYRCGDLTVGGSTIGSQISILALFTDSETPAGSWDIWYADMSIISGDGTVVPIIGAQPPTPSCCYFNGDYNSTPVAYAETVLAGSDPTGAAGALATTSYLMSDHLGTAQLEFSAGGWPVWQEHYTPFGEEIDPQFTTNNYKVTGKERDAESGLDYFGARHYGSTIGRFMSPDPSGLEYADPTNPQSLNLYAYVLNNPLIYIDPRGLDCVYFNNEGDGVESVDHKSDSDECGINGGDWVNGTTYVDFASYNSKNDTWKIASWGDESGTPTIYWTEAHAPDSPNSSNWLGGTQCYGNCDTPNGYSSTSYAFFGSQIANSNWYDALHWAVGQTNQVSRFQKWAINDPDGQNWCGTGGAGVPSGQDDWACMAHDYNYMTTGNKYPGGNWVPFSGNKQLQYINQTLCNNVPSSNIKNFFTYTSFAGCN